MTLIPKRIRSFYVKGFDETEFHRNWPWLWSKHFRIETTDHRLIKLNRYRNRLNFESLTRFCQEYTPLHVYMNTLNWFSRARRVCRGLRRPSAT